MNLAANTPAGPLMPLDEESRASVLIVVIGLDEAATREVIEQAELSREGQEPRPVFVTDLDHFQFFIAQGLLFEHITSAVSRSLAPAGLDWPHYMNRRLDLLVAKWQPTAIIPFGPGARDIVRRWRDDKML